MDWIDPTLGYPNMTLIEGVTEIKDGHYVAVRKEWAHKTLGRDKVYHTKHLDHTGGDDWELFVAQLRKDNLVWGQFVEGLGLIHVMVDVSNIRELSPEERERLSHVVVGMYGSHSGNLSYSFKLNGIADQVPPQFETT